jgi:crotonobetaine/carnitine-CoA ligase
VKGASPLQLDLEQRTIPKLLARASQQWTDRPFIDTVEEAATYGQVADRARRIASYLIRELKVQRGDNVAMFMLNSVDFVATWFGTTMAGATAVPINTAFKGELLRYVLADCEAKVLVIDHALLAEVAAVGAELPAIQHVIVRAGTAEPVTSNWTLHRLGDLATAPDTADLPAVSHRDVANILYSSGTTGPAKGIMLPHAHAISFGAQWIDVMRMTPDDTVYSPMPLFYMFASLLGVMPTLLLGTRFHLGQRFSASSYWDEVRRTGATLGHTIFSLIPILLKQPESPLDRKHNCRAVYIGKTNVEFEERFGARIVEIYGSTEMNIVTYNPWEAHRPGSCGKAAPNFEVQVVDEDDSPLPPNELGEIVARPREPLTISYGYYKKPEATAAAWRNLWFHCGDRGYVDEDGYFFYVDRSKDVIRRRGENISSYEVERQVNAHPAVLESAAIAAGSEFGEDEVKVCVVLRAAGTVSEAQLVADLASTMPSFMLPRYVEFIGELPKTTSSMKIEKYKLQAKGITTTTWDRTANAYALQPAGSKS